MASGGGVIQGHVFHVSDQSKDGFHYSGRRGNTGNLSASSMETAYQRELWRAWVATADPHLEHIDVRRRDLETRMSGLDSFDDGRTASWLTRESGRLVWTGVRDRRTGHEIHCVSDRHVPMRSLRLGLRIMAWLSQRPYVWFWWDQDWQRVLPAQVDPGREHVNGGWAVPGVLEVHVYRREEALKVMIHESVHALGLDVDGTAIGRVRSQFEATLGRRLWPHLGEAYTELFAEWLWAIASARSDADAARRWAAQVRCSAGQAAAVWVRIRDSREDEDTNVFAYYVLKWVLMDTGHLREALLQPSHAVHSWYPWFRAALPRLEAMAAQAARTEERVMRMGMTCGAV
jgi:hypothetical protein